MDKFQTKVNFIYYLHAFHILFFNTNSTKSNVKSQSNVNGNSNKVLLTVKIIQQYLAPTIERKLPDVQTGF